MWEHLDSEWNQMHVDMEKKVWVSFKKAIPEDCLKKSVKVLKNKVGYTRYLLPSFQELQKFLFCLINWISMCGDVSVKCYTYFSIFLEKYKVRFIWKLHFKVCNIIPFNLGKCIFLPVELSWFSKFIQWKLHWVTLPLFFLFSRVDLAIQMFWCSRSWVYF